MSKVAQIADGVYSIGQKKGGYVHAFLLEEDDTGLTLIDTLYDTDAQRILDQIRRMNRKVTDLKRILLTHGHRSHLGGLFELREMSNAEVYSHEWEADIIEGQRTAQPVPILPMRPVRDYWRVYHLQLGAAIGVGKHPPCKVDKLLTGKKKDGKQEQVGPVEVYHTPGHSPGHLAFYWRDRGVLFAGDAVVTYPIFAAGWPAFTLNREQQQESLKRMADLEPQVVAVGHGPPIIKGAAASLHRLLAKSG